MKCLRGHRAIGYATLLCTALASAGSLSRGVFVYSSLCGGEEDAGGAQIVLIRDATGDSALFTRTEGAIMAPLLAFGPAVKIDERSGHVSLRFVDPEFGKQGIYQFEGTISEDVVDIRSEGYVGHLLLPRVKNLPAKLPRCGK